ncbi:hypothetical protein SESBI_43309 [Sesbania bispinosa]|nr:hypothetical protein SESBI_43309 [Sesbania bispinosa]
MSAMVSALTYMVFGDVPTGGDYTVPGPDQPSAIAEGDDVVTPNKPSSPSSPLALENS